MNLLSTLQPVPAPPHATLIQDASKLAIFAGITLVLAALPPIRRAARTLLDRVAEIIYGPSRTMETVSAPAEDTTPIATIRREIEDFDLDMFE